MNCTKLILFGSVALALCAVPATNAQGRYRGAGAGRSFGSTSRSHVTTGTRSFNGQGYRTAAIANRSAFNGRAYRGGNWNGHGGHHGGHHGHHHGHYYGGYYPYYSYYPFGFGFGYPYWGSSFYYGSDYAYDGYGGNAGYGRHDGNSVATNVQQELARAGYYHGAIDGIIGDGTRRAIRAYESANGLPVDGRIDADLLSHMGLS